MASKGCNNCGYYQKRQFKIWGDDIPRKCLAGNDKEFENWWKKNDKKINMPCYEKTKRNEASNDIGKLLDELDKALISAKKSK